MYAVALLIIYVPLSIWSKHRHVWAIVSFVTIIELMSRLIYGHNDIELYVIRATAALFGGLFLCKISSKLAIWESLVYFSTLLAYLALSIDIAANRHILIYNHFEAVIHGLVACQLIGVFYTMAISVIHIRSNSASRMGHIRGDKTS